jgi:hypothetical protein
VCAFSRERTGAALGEKKSGAIFTEEDLELLRTLTNQSAIAIVNARSYRSLAETNAQLRAALRKVELLEHVKTHLGKFVPASVRRLIESDPTAPALDKHEQDVTVFEGAAGTRWTFTASGPVTNLAARIGAFATGGAIYIGEATAQRLSEAFELRDLGAQVFKNVREPVVVYEVLGQRVLAAV